MDLSVCICTFNRARLLEGALAALADAEAPPRDRWEILVVDNNSQDETRRVVSGFEAKLPIRYLLEKEQGQSHARNRACRECGGELLLFVDDDVRVDRNWLIRFSEAGRRHLDAEFFGGRVLPEWPTGRPRWLRDENLALLSGLIVKYDLGPVSRVYRAEDPVPFGASFAIRRSLFERQAQFRTDLGPKGNTPGRGDDVEYLERARAAGSSGVYVANAVSFHLVDPVRFKLTYLYRFGVQKGIAHSRLHPEQASAGSVLQELSYLARGIGQLLRGHGDRFRQCVINMGLQAGLRREARERKQA